MKRALPTLLSILLLLFPALSSAAPVLRNDQVLKITPKLTPPAESAQAADADAAVNEAGGEVPDNAVTAPEETSDPGQEQQTIPAENAPAASPDTGEPTGSEPVQNDPLKEKIEKLLADPGFESPVEEMVRITGELTQQAERAAAEQSENAEITSPGDVPDSPSTETNAQASGTDLSPDAAEQAAPSLPVSGPAGEVQAQQLSDNEPAAEISDKAGAAVEAVSPDLPSSGGTAADPGDFPAHSRTAEDVQSESVMPDTLIPDPVMPEMTAQDSRTQASQTLVAGTAPAESGPHERNSRLEAWAGEAREQPESKEDSATPEAALRDETPAGEAEADTDTTQVRAAPVPPSPDEPESCSSTVSTTESADDAEELSEAGTPEAETGDAADPAPLEAEQADLSWERLPLPPAVAAILKDPGFESPVGEMERITAERIRELRMYEEQAARKEEGPVIHPVILPDIPEFVPPEDIQSAGPSRHRRRLPDSARPVTIWEDIGLDKPWAHVDTEDVLAKYRQRFTDGEPAGHKPQGGDAPVSPEKHYALSSDPDEICPPNIASLLDRLLKPRVTFTDRMPEDDAPMIVRWTAPLRVRVMGRPPEPVSSGFRLALARINSVLLSSGGLTATLTDSGENIRLHILPGAVTDDFISLRIGLDAAISEARGFIAPGQISGITPRQAADRLLAGPLARLMGLVPAGNGETASQAAERVLADLRVLHSRPLSTGMERAEACRAILDERSAAIAAPLTDRP